MDDCCIVLVRHSLFRKRISSLADQMFVLVRFVNDNLTCQVFLCIGISWTYTICQPEDLVVRPNDMTDKADFLLW